MPFKSQAQRRKFAELLVKGEITPETFEEWNRATGTAKLPERVKPKGRRATKGRKKKATPRSRKRAPSKATTGSKKKSKNRSKSSRP
jgi:hypothetical protein